VASDSIPSWATGYSVREGMSCCATDWARCRAVSLGTVVCPRWRIWDRNMRREGIGKTRLVRRHLNASRASGCSWFLRGQAQASTVRDGTAVGARWSVRSWVWHRSRRRDAFTGALGRLGHIVASFVDVLWCVAAPNRLSAPSLGPQPQVLRWSLEPALGCFFAPGRVCAGPHPLLGCIRPGR
jgi:hypothetical protein